MRIVRHERTGADGYGRKRDDGSIVASDGGPAGGRGAGAGDRAGGRGRTGRVGGQPAGAGGTDRSVVYPAELPQARGGVGCARCPSIPILFMKLPSAVQGPHAAAPAVKRPGLDYEAEPTVVIGRRCHNVAREAALDYVLGTLVATTSAPGPGRFSRAADNGAGGRPSPPSVPWVRRWWRRRTFPILTRTIKTVIKSETMRDWTTRDIELRRAGVDRLPARQHHAGARHGDHDRSPYGVGAPRLARRILVIFTPNHGKLLGDQGIYRKGPYSYDQAVSLPGTISGGWASDALITDLAPTLADAAGLPVPASMPGPLLGGRSSPATGRSPRCARTPTANTTIPASCSRSRSCARPAPRAAGK